jgi:DNA-binding transcriptional ArsR family regulator
MSILWHGRKNLRQVKPSEETLDKIFFALSDRNRRKILKYLSKDESPVGDLAAHLGISLPGTMKHLGILEDAKLVDLEKNGRVRSCTFNLKGFNSAMSYIEEYQVFWNEKFDNIEKILAESEVEHDDR